MEMRIPADLERFVHDEVRAGRYPTEDEVIRDALERLRQHARPAASERGSLGAMRDADDLEEIVKHAMELRKQPWRVSPGA